VQCHKTTIGLYQLCGETCKTAMRIRGKINVQRHLHIRRVKTATNCIQPTIALQINQWQREGWIRSWPLTTAQRQGQTTARRSSCHANITRVTCCTAVRHYNEFVVMNELAGSHRTHTNYVRGKLRSWQFRSSVVKLLYRLLAQSFRSSLSLLNLFVSFLPLSLSFFQSSTHS
jgi:hypothetical protein